jgi:hypothetical protein
MESDLLATVTRDTLGIDGSYTSSNFMPIYNHHHHQQQQQQQQQQTQPIYGQPTASILHEMNGNIQRLATVMEREMSMINIQLQKIELALVNHALHKPEQTGRRDKIVVPVEFEWLPPKLKSTEGRETKSTEVREKTDKRVPEKRKNDGHGMYSKPSYGVPKKSKP